MKHAAEGEYGTLRCHTLEYGEDAIGPVWTYTTFCCFKCGKFALLAKIKYFSQHCFTNIKGNLMNNGHSRQ